MGLQALALVLTAAVLLWAPIAVVWVVATGERPHWAWLYAGALTAFFHTIYQLVLQRGYERGDLNLVYPLARGTGPLLTFLFAVGVLGERPGAIAAAGVVA